MKVTIPPKGVTEFTATIYPDSTGGSPYWQTANDWLDTTPYTVGGEAQSPSTLYEADYPLDSARDGDDVEIKSYTQQNCPSALWVYVDDGYVKIQTTKAPTNNVLINGFVVHR